jgi:hypothetical protein
VYYIILLMNYLKNNFMRYIVILSLFLLMVSCEKTKVNYEKILIELTNLSSNHKFDCCTADISNREVKKSLSSIKRRRKAAFKVISREMSLLEEVVFYEIMHVNGIKYDVWVSGKYANEVICYSFLFPFEGDYTTKKIDKKFPLKEEQNEICCSKNLGEDNRYVSLYSHFKSGKKKTNLISYNISYW